MTRRTELLLKIGGYFVGAIGLAAALVSLYPVVFPPTPDNEILLIPSPNIPNDLSPLQAADFKQLVIRSEVSINEPVEVDSPVYVVANHLSFGERGVLKAPEITIFATNVTGGRLDVSGSNATEEGKDGLKGGSIFVAAAHLQGTVIVAEGGNGARGQRGRGGSRGRVGRCSGFGRWRKAQNGGSGGRGGKGGSGGPGGTVTVVVSKEHGFPAANARVDGGDYGQGGQGGPGGPGGSGCTGLGGTQRAAPAGPAGPSGDSGDLGEDGVVVIQEIGFRDVKEAVGDNLGSINIAKLNAAKEQLTRDTSSERTKK